MSRTIDPLTNFGSLFQVVCFVFVSGQALQELSYQQMVCSMPLRHYYKRVRKFNLHLTLDVVVKEWNIKIQTTLDPAGYADKIEIWMNFEHCERAAT